MVKHQVHPRQACELEILSWKDYSFKTPKGHFKVTLDEKRVHTTLPRLRYDIDKRKTTPSLARVLLVIKRKSIYTHEERVSIGYYSLCTQKPMDSPDPLWP